MAWTSCATARLRMWPRTRLTASAYGQQHMAVPGIGTYEVLTVTELPEQGSQVPDLSIRSVGIQAVSLGYEERIGIPVKDQSCDRSIVRSDGNGSGP